MPNDMQQYSDALRTIERNTLKAIVLNLMRQLSRENWFNWSSQEAQLWLEKQVQSREQGFTPVQQTAIALLVMQNVCRSV